MAVLYAAMSFEFVKANRFLPDGSTEPGEIQRDDLRYFKKNPQAKAYLRPMRPGEFGEYAPAMPDNLPVGLQCSFCVYVESHYRGAGYPRRIFRRLILVAERMP
jgi:hypothetical protein